MSDQNHTIIDSKSRWPASESDARIEQDRGPGIVSADSQGRITSWNRAAALMLANAGGALAQGQPFLRLELEAGRACSITFSSSIMADGSLICLCEQVAPATQASPLQASTPLASVLPSALPLPSPVPHLLPAMDNALTGIAGSFSFIRNPLPLWIFDRETLAFVAVNDAALARYGYSREQFLSLKI